VTTYVQKYPKMGRGLANLQKVLQEGQTLPKKMEGCGGCPYEAPNFGRNIKVEFAKNETSSI
jgi:hypothetical protein